MEPGFSVWLNHNLEFDGKSSECDDNYGVAWMLSRGILWSSASQMLQRI